MGQTLTVRVSGRASETISSTGFELFVQRETYVVRSYSFDMLLLLIVEQVNKVMDIMIVCI